MKRISYEVKAYKDNLNTELKNNKFDYSKIIAEIIYKRKEKGCYEDVSKKRIDFKKM